MKNNFLLLAFSFLAFSLTAQTNLTPELLWDLGRVSALGITNDGTNVIYKVKKYDAKNNASSGEVLSIPLNGGEVRKIETTDGLISNQKISPDGKFQLIDKKVKISKILGKDHYPDLEKSNVYIFDDLMYRHWDSWSEGNYNHVFIKSLETGEEIDISLGDSCGQHDFLHGF